MGIVGIFRNVGLICVSFAGAYFGVSFIYHVFIGALDYAIFAWIVAAYTFFVSFLLVIFGGKYKHWWIIVSILPFFYLFLRLFLPPLEFISSFDFLEFFFFLAVWSIFLGTAIGFGVLVRKLFLKLAPGVMAKLSG